MYGVVMMIQGRRRCVSVVYVTLSGVRARFVECEPLFIPLRAFHISTPSATIHLCLAHSDCLLRYIYFDRLLVTDYTSDILLDCLKNRTKLEESFGGGKLHREPAFCRLFSQKMSFQILNGTYIISIFYTIEGTFKLTLSIQN